MESTPVAAGINADFRRSMGMPTKPGKTEGDENAGEVARVRKAAASPQGSFRQRRVPAGVRPSLPTSEQRDPGASSKRHLAMNATPIQVFGSSLSNRYPNTRETVSSKAGHPNAQLLTNHTAASSGKGNLPKESRGTGFREGCHTTCVRNEFESGDSIEKLSTLRKGHSYAGQVTRNRQRAFSEPFSDSGDVLTIHTSLSGDQDFDEISQRHQLGSDMWRRETLGISPNNLAVVGTTPTTRLAASTGGSFGAARSSLTNSDRPSGDFEAVSTSEIGASDGSVTDERGRRRVYRRNSVDDSSIEDNDPDPHRQARIRWITINRRFQVIIAIVAFIFSVLLFSILVSWVVLTSAYVVSIDKTCDIPLKIYYWMFTLQLILDVFRSEIMRLIFQWDASSVQRIPCRVIAYNVGYLAYALLVLWTGLHSVYWSPETTCSATAPSLFRSSKTVVSLSVAAWCTIIGGYLVPFFVVASLLTWNGYNPSADGPREGSRNPFTVFPTTMRAPPGCIDRIPTVQFEDFHDDFPAECCICMESFTGTDVIVQTPCLHVFHKKCCREWLQQARTCPVCRKDIPTSLDGQDEEYDDQESGSSNLGRGSSTLVARNDIHTEVVSLLQILRRRDQRHRRSDSFQANSRGVELREEGSRSTTRHITDRTSSFEEGRLVR